MAVNTFTIHLRQWSSKALCWRIKN